MRFAIIDLGTNTFNLLIGELNPQKTNYRKIFNTKIPVKLGEKAINLGHIDDIPFQRGINALVQYKKYINDYCVEKTFAIATSAIRSASNGSEFVYEAFEKTQISISVIDGNEEAELIYLGNRMAVKMTNDISLIMDIGGGSTEFVLANDKTIFWKKSFLLGASRIFEKFDFSNPITQNEQNDFYNYLDEELKPLFEAVKNHKPIELIGSSGAFDSVVDIISAEFNKARRTKKQTSFEIELEHYFFISNLIKKSTISERHNMNGLIEMRVDMIVISVMLIDFILNRLNISAFRVSTYSLKEGVIFDKLLVKI